MNPLRQFRVKAGLSVQELAHEAGTTQPTINRLETGKRKLTKQWAIRLAPHLGISWQKLQPDEKPVRIAGYARTSAAVFLYDENVRNAGEAERPAGAPDTTVALEVKGEPVRGFAEEGWLIYYDERRCPPPEYADPRSLYVCGLADKRIVVRKLRPGSRPGLYHLLSTASDPEFDVPVDWAARVTWIKPI